MRDTTPDSKIWQEDINASRFDDAKIWRVGRTFLSADLRCEKKRLFFARQWEWKKGQCSQRREMKRNCV
jgi:hypothetical protein